MFHIFLTNIRLSMNFISLGEFINVFVREKGRVVKV
jgi:hypothetical protein